jgi:MYXO-CTERM domain-containing protein
MLLLMPFCLAFASTDTIGGDDVENDLGDMMKLVGIEVSEAAVVTVFEFGSDGEADEPLVLVLYRRDGGSYRLVEQVEVPVAGGDWATSGPVAWLLEPDQTYAFGAYVPDGFTYFYDERESESPWFGEVTEAYRVEERVPDDFRAEGEEYWYLMRITSEDADVDDDGAIAAVWGGTDCDDTDPDRVAASDEVPYDGIDQDCDGADLVDVDEDGEPAIEAGGADCDDTTGAVAPSRAEVCGDGVDNDCSGSDEACDGDNPDDEGGIEIVADDCGCATTPAAPGFGLLGLLAAATLRRRRPSGR